MHIKITEIGAVSLDLIHVICIGVEKGGGRLPPPNFFAKIYIYEIIYMYNHRLKHHVQRHMRGT